MTERSVATMLREGVLVDREIQGILVSRDGTRRPIEYSAAPIKDERGGLQGSVLVFRDLTERRRAKERLDRASNALKQSHDNLEASQHQLIRAEQMESVGRLAVGVAHEVKNPLGILLAAVEYLREHLADPDDTVTATLHDMEDAIRRADTVIRGLLDFSAPSGLDLQVQGLNDIVEQSLLLMKHDLTRAHVNVVKTLAYDLPSIRVDRGKLEQMFVNLLMNAIQAMPDGGTLSVRTCATTLAHFGPQAGRRATDRFKLGETVVMVEIDDTGSGISDEHITKVFDPFFTTKPKGKGTGLGLAVTRKIIDLHEGAIDIRNRKSGGVRIAVMFKTHGG